MVKCFEAPTGELVYYPDWGEEILTKYKKWRVQNGNRKRKGTEERVRYLITDNPRRRPRILFFHRLLYPDLAIIHHKDGNGLNNVESNISSGNTVKKKGNSLMSCIQWAPFRSGYYVRLVDKRIGKRVCRSFTISKYGDNDSARRAAIKWRNEMQKEIAFESN